MKVALTAWEDKISPVFDSARTLLIAEIKNAKIISRRYELFNSEMPHSLADSLGNLGVEVLICGAISEMPAKIIEARGINLIPFIGGKLEEVLASYAKENKIKSIFLMPGCGGKRKRTRNCNIFSKQQKEVKIMPRGDGAGPQGQSAGTGRGSGGSQPKKDGKGSGRRTGRGAGQGQGKGGGQGRGGQN